MAVQDFFTWGAGGQKLTPGDLARRREIEDSLLAKGPDFSPVADWTQGLARVANAAAGAYRRNRLGKAEGENAEINKGLIANLLAGGSSATSPASSSAIPMSGAAGEMAATSPVSTVGATGPEAYRNAIASIESAGSGDYSAIGPTNDKLGRALGRYQIMEASIGPWSQEALGRAVTPEEFLADPALQDAIFDKKFGSYVEQFGPEGAAQAWFAGPGGVGKVNRQDVLGTNVGEYGSRFLSALGSGGGTPAAAAIDAVAPAAAGEVAMQQATSAQPVQVAGGGDRVPMASSSTGINPAIIEALTNPQASEQTQRIAGILLQQDQARQNASMDEQNWRARQEYEQELLAQDPLRMAQIEKLQRENAQPPGSDETFYGNPVAVQNADGSVAYGQIGNRGTFRPIQLGEGQSFAPPTRNVNTGTEILQVDQAGNVISRTPVNNREAASERAAGTEEGQTRVQREMAAPAEIQAGQNALSLLDNIRNDPYLARGTGGTSLFNRIPGTGGYDFSNKVEQAKSGAFLTAIQQMRGLGALSNAEGSAATAAITRMDTATSEEAFKAALDDYEKIVRQGIDRAQGRLRGNAAPTGNKTSTGVQWSVE